ncbi:MAG: hypothetical protein EOP00_04715 [Pedobacter sp.]|nr:MAG: hypothetical protein EOP00_04715 [Pedobacter sp.]
MIKPSFLIGLLETDKEILAHKFDEDLPIWPIIRHDIITNIINHNNNLVIPHSKSKPKFASLLKTIWVAIYKNPLIIKRNKIIFFNSGITNIKQDTDGRYFNRVTDQFFSKIQEDAVLIEDTAMGELRLPRVHDKAYPHLALIAVSKILGFFRKISETEIESIENMLNCIYKILIKENIQFNEAALRNIGFNNVLGYLKKRRAYELFFKLKKPKIIFLEDASYGNKSFISIPAKKQGILIIELQHGFINEDHIAYNLGPGVMNAEVIKQFYPDTFFAYGEFWKKSISIPSKILSIGNPFLTAQVQQFKAQDINANSCKNILFISSAVSMLETVAFVTTLKQTADLHNYGVTIRPHPLELNVVQARYQSLILLGVKISHSNSVYSDFSTHDIIIGEVSTALFESLIIPNKRHFLFTSSYTKSYLNESITIPQINKDSISIIFEESNFSQVNSLYFWEDNWEENFINALKQFK